MPVVAQLWALFLLIPPLEQSSPRQRGFAEGGIAVRHGSPIIMLGVVAGGIAFLLDGNVLVALGAAVLVLLITAIIANRRAIEDQPAPREVVAAAPAQAVDAHTPLSRPTALAAVA